MCAMPRAFGLLVAVIAFLGPRIDLWAEDQPVGIWAEGQPGWAEQIEKLVRQLNDDEATQRDEAEQAILKLALQGNSEQNDNFLACLPRPIKGMPAEVQLRLARIRKQIENEQTERSLQASRLTLVTGDLGLEGLLDEIHRQTGNRLNDYRRQFGQEALPLTFTLDIKNESFWIGLDKILDQARLGLYTYSGEEALAIIQGEQGAAPRAGRACYTGPFRVEAVNVVSQRNLRMPSQQGGRVELEIAWEPRLRPIALLQSAEKLKITADDGSPVELAGAQSVFAVEVQPGSHATELNIPFVLPERSVEKIATFRGELSALVPGRTVEFRFEDLTQDKPQEQQRGGVKVVLHAVRKNQQLWEVHMRLRVESEEAALESHRGWVFQNLTYLLNKQGELIDHAGLETTMQSTREIGLVYFFDLPDDEIDSYTWVYRTPAAIVRMPVKFELKDIELP